MLENNENIIKKKMKNPASVKKTDKKTVLK